MPTPTNIGFDLGEDWLIEVDCHQADGKTVLDLSGASATLYVGPVANPKLSAAGTLSGTPTDGKVTFHVLPGAQVNLAPGGYPYVVRVTLGSGIVTDQAFGTLTARGT